MKAIYKKLLLLLLVLPFSALAQSTLSGTVTDKVSGQPLPGVNVVVEGSNNGVSTDFDGKYQLTNVKSGETVVFSYVGYKAATVKFTGQATENVSLEEDANQLQEVVVQVGYGTVKKKDATGAVTTVTTKDFNKGANVTTENLLNGRVAGVTINTSGAPGSGSQIRIRGGASLFASNDPLIVVDGLPIDNATNTGSTSFLASINPSTIESITVLKDASATAIYGSRASNGVIIIVTKSGTKKLSVDYNFLYGSGKYTDLVDVFSADEFRQVIADNYPVGDPNRDLLGTANTNWQDAIYRRTDYVDNNLSLRGNLFDVIPTRFTIGNTYQEGLRLTNTFNRNSASVSMNPSFLDNHLKLRVNANYSMERNRFADDVTYTAVRFDPTQPVYDPASPYAGFFEYYTSPTNSALLLAPRNPVAQLLQTNDTGKNNRFFGNFELDYKFHFFPSLRAVVNVGFDEANGERNKFVPAGIAASAPSNGSDIFGKNEHSEEIRRNKLLDAYLVYNKDLDKVNIEVTGGYSYQSFNRQERLTGNINDPNLGTNFPETNTDTEIILIGLFGRANISYLDKYLLTLSYRRDGSTKFGADNRWGNFPAASFAWKMNEEFFKDSKTVTDLKLRLGYGITGQQNIQSNVYFQSITTGDGVSQYYFGSAATPVAIPNRINPKIKWEETTTFNVGLDYGLFNNRITGAIDAFYKVSDDLLVDAAVPDGSNNSNRAFQNVGSFTTKGIEFSINAQVAKSDKFNWNVNFNATTYQRKIDELIYHADIFVGENVGGTGTPGQILSEGFSPYSFYVYKQLYDTAGHPIEGAYADINRDGVINGNDRYIYKNPDPDVTFGFASTLNYGNLDFSFNLRASVGNHNYNGVAASQAQLDLLKTDQALNNVLSSVLETGFNTTSNVLLSDIYIENASFLRMDNITVGYTFPKWLNSDSSVRLSLGVQNAFVITNYSGLDPEITNNGLDKTIYPRQRQVLFGVNVKF
jgi:TonB-linked SusC/RagA family outer membrane protein